MMAEYIEREDALKEVDHSLSLSEAYSRIASRIIAADVVEVRRGRWEEHPQDTFAREHHCEKLRCTRCWHFFYHNYGDNKLYCPNCGARMDGDV